jgi:hypothetical protein
LTRPLQRVGRALADRAGSAPSNPLRLLESPVVDLGDEKVESFEAALAATSPGEAVEYHLPWPKYELLHYLVERRGLLLHGSNRATVRRLEPRDQGDFEGKPVRAVFATDDEIWPIYFAVVDRSLVRGLANDCIHVRRDGVRRSRYLFAITGDPADAGSWTTGAVYAVRRRTFVQQPQPREWLSPVAVEPVCAVAVDPGDFPFVGDVLTFAVGETMARIHLRHALAHRRAGLVR